MAAVLASDLRRRPRVESVTVLDGLSVLGARLGSFLASGFELHLGRVQWSYDLAYRLFANTAPGRRAGEEALYRLGGRALSRAISAHRPDVVVSTYPVLNPVLARLRAAGSLRPPAAAVVEPLGGLAFWVHPHLDMHLLHYPESLPEVARLGGGRTACPVRPLVREEFFERPDRARARDRLGVAEDRRLVLLSGGGWGAGDLLGAARVCLRVPSVELIVVAGRNERARAALRASLSDVPGARVLGFTERMPELLVAADALVTTTAGLSCIEARLCGCPVVCHGFAIGHVRDNTRALRHARLVRTAASAAELCHELTRALQVDGERSRGARWEELPSAADLLIALAEGMVGPCDGAMPALSPSPHSSQL